MDATSITLVERLRKPHDKGAWERFVGLYSPMLTRWARAAGLQDQDAADLVQDVFLVLFKKLPEFEYDASKSFRRWLKTIVTNKWRDRVKCRRNHLAQAFDGELEELPEQQSVFSEVEYRRQLMFQALESVKGDYQEKTWRAFVEHGLSGRLAAAVATELQMSEGAVYVAKSRILARLRQELGSLLD